MKLDIVPVEIAKDLKNLDFEWECNYLYPRDYNNFDGPVKFSNRRSNIENISVGGTPAPEQALVVKWFRKVYDIHIQPTYFFGKDTNISGYKLYIIFGISSSENGLPFDYIQSVEDLNIKYNGGIMKGAGIIFFSYEEAELEGIKIAIQYLKSKNYEKV